MSTKKIDYMHLTEYMLYLQQPFWEWSRGENSKSMIMIFKYLNFLKIYEIKIGNTISLF